MKKIFAFLTLLILTACSNGVVIKDGTHDAIIGDSRENKSCEVHVSKDNTAHVEYSSDGCTITITPSTQE